MVSTAIRFSAPPRTERTTRRARRGRPAPSMSSLLELGMIDEVEARIASTTDRLDALTWATMRALLLGQRGPAAAGIEKLGELARASEDRGATERHWLQRF